MPLLRQDWHLAYALYQHGYAHEVYVPGCPYGGEHMIIGKFQLLLLGLMALYPVACIASGQLSTAQLGQASFNDRTGQVTESDLYLRLPRILARHGFYIRSGERVSQSLFFETEWRNRQLFPDEQSTGITAARTRLRFKASWTGKFYSLRLMIDNEIQRGSGPWIQGHPGRDFLAYARGIAHEIRTEIASGMRRY